MIIALDAMGGDHAPANPVAGAVLAVRELGIKSILVGDEGVLKEELKKNEALDLGLEIVHAPQAIAMEEKTMDAMKNKKNSSIHVAARLVKEGKAQGFVSAGHTGAAMAITKIITGSLKKVKRPALAIALPTLGDTPTLFMDVGANVSCRSEHLVQFAIMGRTYAEDVLHVKDPRIGVLSNGEEATKGNEVIRKTVDRLSKAGIRFVGPVEGKDLFHGEVDVVVTDGFTGNAVLKAVEAVASLTFASMKEEINKSWVAKLGALLMRGSLRNLKQKFDYSEYGGAPLLGLKEACIICHGRSNPTAIKNAIRVAAEFSENQASSHIQRGIVELYESDIFE